MEIALSHKGTGEERPNFPFLGYKRGHPKVLCLVGQHGAVILTGDGQFRVGDGWYEREARFYYEHFIPLPEGSLVTFKV